MPNVVTPDTKSRSSSAPRRVGRPGWFAAALLIGLGGAGLGIYHGASGAEPRGGARHVESTRDLEPSTSPGKELRPLKDSIRALERRLSALEAALAAADHVSSSSARTPATPTADAEDDRSAEERHQDMLRNFDEALVTEPGDARDVRATADALRSELTAAIDGRAEILEVECATAFCKAVIEEDTTSPEGLDMSAFMAGAPSLRREAMFEHELEGTRKRTIVYAAREGRSLSAPQEAAGGVAQIPSLRNISQNER